MLSVALWLIPLVARSACAGEAPRGPRLDVIPLPRQVTFEEGVFEIDGYTAIVVSDLATGGTRRAARALQLALRERFGVDLPIVLIADQLRLGRPKAIWVIEPRLRRSPGRTIGPEDLTFREEMTHEGYFIRVDMTETVVHGATDAGTYYGVQTLIQLIRPPRPGTLLRARRGPTIPCLVIADWPRHRTRPVPADLQVPSDPDAAEQFLRAAARARLNAVEPSGPLADEAAGDRLRGLARELAIRIVDDTPVLPSTFAISTPLNRTVMEWYYAQSSEADPILRYPLAAVGEVYWGSKDLDPGRFRRRFAQATFGTEAAAEAIELTERYFRRGVLCIPDELLERSARLAAAAGEEARRAARERADHERCIRRIRSLWGSVKAEPALRAAFLAVAEREAARWGAVYALADARGLLARGRAADAASLLRARRGSLAALGDGAAAAAQRLFDALIVRLEAAAETGTAVIFDFRLPNAD